MSTEQSLRITEVFYSLQGESLSVGAPTVFVRLTGCPLRCHYCDSAYAFHGGEKRTLQQLFEQIQSYNTRFICVTGGEPLAQPGCLDLLRLLCDQGYEVSLETSGALSIEGVDTRVSRVVDLKTPDSGESDRNLYDNLHWLTPKDQIKFVICSERDYQWAKFKLDEYDLSAKATVLFSPSFEQIDSTSLAQWVLRDQLPVRMQLQLHKILWGDVPGR